MSVEYLMGNRNVWRLKISRGSSCIYAPLRSTLPWPLGWSAGPNPVYTCSITDGRNPPPTIRTGEIGHPTRMVYSKSMQFSEPGSDLFGSVCKPSPVLRQLPVCIHRSPLATRTFPAAALARQNVSSRTPTQSTITQ